MYTKVSQAIHMHCINMYCAAGNYQLEMNGFRVCVCVCVCVHACIPPVAMGNTLHGFECF